MPMVKETHISKPGPTVVSHRHQAFLSLLFITFFTWTTYRLLFQFPVWFDEIIGKLVFFGLPVWLYIILSQSRVTLNTIKWEKFYPGLFLGLAMGGLYGFVGTLATLTGESQLQTAALFLSTDFWWQFFLAVVTGFWESLFFFGWVYVIAEKRFPQWGRLHLVFFATAVFVIFHIPNMLLQAPLYTFASQLFLMTFFALGQSFLFNYYRNVYALTISHAIWGMVLLIYANS